MQIAYNHPEITEFNSHRDFKNEKELCDYLEHNLAQFVKEDLGYELDDYQREWPINGKVQRGQRAYAIDFFIVTKCGKSILVEAKHPNAASFTGLTKAIGQVLGYKSAFKENGIHVDECVIISSYFNHLAYKTIADNNLPVQIIVLNKSKVIYGSANRE